VQLLREFSEDTYGARRINNRFGEGASPRLRQIREGLEALGIESDDVLNHATPRLFYVCALNEDAKEQLIGLRTKAPKQQASAEQISEAWRQRWLYSRIQSDDILDQVAERNAETIRSDLLPVDVYGQPARHPHGTERESMTPTVPATSNRE
jgi:chemotaxis regulatin CheY-phosphate phosphatase CheZ